MNPKEKMILMTLGAVSGLIMLALCILIYSNFGEMSQAKQLRDDQNDTHTRYYNQPIFPSEENITIVKENQNVMNKWIQKTIDFIATSNVEERNEGQQFLGITEGRLAERITERIRKLNERQILPRSFDAEERRPDFGFAKYFIDAEPIESKDALRLATQFYFVEMISNIFFEVGGKSISTVKRIEFEKEAVVQEVTSGRSNRNARNAKPVAPVPTEARVPTALEGELSKETFTFTVEADYKALGLFMNRIIKQPLMVITEMNIIGQTNVKDKFDDINQKIISNENEQEENASGQSKVKKIEARDLVLTDTEINKPLSIVFTIDVYSAIKQKTEGK